VLRIANNLVIDYLRRRERRREMSLDILMSESSDSEWCGLELADSSHDPAKLVLQTVIVEGLEESIARLPPSQRKLLTLLESGHSYQEIADIMHCPAGTVRSRVHRTRQRLQEALSAPGER
jgi:RNA polymerase sigma-70 factor, ECF subfamily